jgi:hypothetical protein
MSIRLKSSTARMSHRQRSDFLRSIIFHMTNNSYFPEPWAAGLSLAICIMLADKYDSWIIAGGRGDRDNIATRNEVAVEVQALLEKLAHYVEMTAGDDLAALRSSGYELRQRHGKTNSSHTDKAFTLAGVRHQQVARVENLPEARQILLHASWGPGVISRQVQTTTGNPGDEASWQDKAVFAPNETMKMECDAGTSAFIRYRDVTAKGIGGWSTPISTFVT